MFTFFQNNVSITRTVRDHCSYYTKYVFTSDLPLLNVHSGATNVFLLVILETNCLPLQQKNAEILCIFKKT